MKRTLLSLPLIAALAACAQFPELDRTITPELQAADFPALVPIGPLIAGAQTDGVDAGQANAQIDARVAALRARAARMRGSVLTGRERQRLAQGLR